MPKRTNMKKVSKNTSDGSNAVKEENIWVTAWRNEIHNTKEAFRFIFRSYVDMPKNLGNMILVNFNKVWNKFVGVKDYLSEEEQDPSVYKLDIKH